jgi:hypothetical protein
MGLLFDDRMRERLRQVREAQLAEMRAGRWQEAAEVLIADETVCLWCGCGNASFVGLDGRVLYWNYGDGWPVEELSAPADVASVVRHGAEAGLPDLLGFLPTMPSGGVTCRQCRGSRWMPPRARTSRDGGPQVCLLCHGLGWTVAEPGAAPDRGGV